MSDKRLFISGKGQLLIYRSDVTPKSVQGKQKEDFSLVPLFHILNDASKTHLLKESCQGCSNLLAFTHGTRLFGRIWNISAATM